MSETPQEKVERLKAELRQAEQDTIERPDEDTRVVWVIARKGSEGEYLDRSTIAATRRSCFGEKMQNEADDGKRGLDDATRIVKCRMVEISSEDL